MNKILSLVAVVALTATLSFAQDMNLGIRAAFNLNFVNIDNGEEIDEKYIDMGIGGGGGLVAIIPISGDVSARTGAEFYYRTLYNINLPGSDKMSASEFALSIPAMVQYSSLFNGQNMWVGIGVQLDIPFATKVHIGDNSSDFEDRSAVDFRIIAGAGGFKLSSNIVGDARVTVFGVDPTKGLVLTKLSSKDGDKSSLFQVLSGGFTYLF
jgi:hypothetical protein